MFAAGTHEPRWTLANGSGEVCVAGSSILTGREAAGIRSNAAVFAREAERARAGVVVDAIHAGAGVLARVACAVVYVDFAIRSLKAWAARTHQSVTQIKTLATISTGIAAASIDLLLTVGAHVSGTALTGVSAGPLWHAGSSVEARSIGTGHSADLTVLSIEALRARAGVTIY